MALITRLSRLFKADMHAVLDRIESPDVLLQQAIREMNEALAADQQQFELLNLECRKLDGFEEQIQLTLLQLEEDLDIAIESPDESLARSVVRRKLEALHRRQQLQTRRKALDEVLAELGQRLEDNSRRLEEMRDKADRLSPGPSAARDAGRWPDPAAHISEQEVELALLQEKKRRIRS